MDPTKKEREDQVGVERKPKKKERRKKKRIKEEERRGHSMAWHNTR